MIAIKKTSVSEEVIRIIAESLGSDPKGIDLRTSLTEDLGADSLDQVELTLSLEDYFGIEITDEEAETLKTVENIVDYIVSKGGK